MEWALEIVLIVLLGAMLFHALRLERALGGLKRDRSTLEQLVASFSSSTHQAEQGVERLRAAADGAGRQVAKQVDAANALKDDLLFLTERGERLADRLDASVRAARPLAPDPVRTYPTIPEPDNSQLAAVLHSDAAEEPRLRSQAERDLAKALRMAR